MFALAGVLAYERARPVGGPAVHVQGDGREDQLAGRHRARGRAAGHRPRSSASCRKCRTRLGAQLLASPASRSCSSRSRTPRRRRRRPRRVRTRCARRSATSATSCRPGIQGPFFNDEFGDTYTNIYAITGDGFGYRELKEFGDKVRAELLRVPGVAKVDFIGEQDEKIFIELSNSKLATLGVEPAQIIADAGARRTRWPPSGAFDTATDRIYVRPTGAFDSRRRDPRLRDPRQQPRVPAGRHREGHAAATSIRRSRRCAGRAARRSASASRWSKGGDVIELGQRPRRASVVRHRSRRCRSASSSRQVASMPRAVQRSINEFLRSLAEAVADRAGGVAREPGLAHRARRRGLDPAGARDDVPVHVAVRHRPAQDLARRADPVAGPARRRRDHRGRDDGDQAGAGLRPLPRGELRLHEHGVPDADRHAGHRRRLPADRDREEQRPASTRARSSRSRRSR